MTAIPIGVNCQFDVDGGVFVRQIYYQGRWQPVEQGRQWLDQFGRHVLIMLPNTTPEEMQVREILLRTTTLMWELVPLRNSQTRIV